jgi:hypothetical protein
MRVPARLQLSDLSTYFDFHNADRIQSNSWGKNSCCILQAVNGKWYWVRYKFKDYDKQWIQVKLTKQDKNGNFSW